jgi:hypothetical protein
MLRIAAMTSSPEDDFLIGLLEDAAAQGDFAIDWATPADLARISREVMAARPTNPKGK